MNILVFCFIICSYSIVFSSVSGRRLHTGNLFYDHKPSFADKSKYKMKQIFNAYSNDKNTDNPTRNEHLFKLNIDASKTNLDGRTDYFNWLPNSSNKRKALRTEVGKHVIKVKSALQSKQLEVKQKKDGGYDISVNPEFSHVIEILPIKKDSLEQDEFGNSEGKEEFDQKAGKEIEAKTGLYTDETVETESVSYDEETENEPYDEEAVETESELYDDEAVETESEPYDDEAVETGDEAYDDAVENEETVEAEHDINPEETVEAEHDINPEETIEVEHDLNPKETVEVEHDLNPEETVEAEHDLNPEEMVEAEHGLNNEETANSENSAETEKTDIHQLSGDVNEESAFSDEFEGSGEDSFRSEDSEDDLTRSGRILGIFSRQNATAPICTTPKGEAGHCRRIRQCVLSDTLNNFNVFLQHLCLIRGALVGICCPDNPVIEITDPDENNTVITNKTDIKQPPEGCGLNVKTRIVGGFISVPHEWTWMVALLRRNRFYCGGVIINNWYILTAAHCVMGINVKDLSVRLGEYDFNEHNKHQEDISVSEIKRHAQFVSLTFQHDIALLKLKRSIQYSKFVGSICLPDSKARDYSDTQGTVVGWGTVSFGGAASPVLRQVTVPIWKNEDCDRTYLLENINDAFLCAGSPEKGEDACQGDSGGPLMALNARGRWEVIGLVSWGRRCGDPTYPGVYTRVTTYLDWIKENVN